MYNVIVKMKEHLGYGNYRCVDNKNYDFVYNVEKDIGLGMLRNLDSGNGYKVLDMWQDDKGIVELVGIEL